MTDQTNTQPEPLSSAATLFVAASAARDQFAFYGREHRAAGKDEKAETNEGFAAMLATALDNAEVPFQSRVQLWLLACFGETIAADRQERNHRFLEESLELVQAAGCTASEAHQLVDYVFGRDVGEPAQEVGGVVVTLAALCLANGLDMHEAGEVELARIWTKVEAIRAKQAAKPKHSPLPVAAAPAALEIDNPARWFFTFAEDAEWWYLGGATYEAALEKAERERDGRPIYLQQAKRMVPKLDEVVLADNVIDAIADDECWGEDGWEGQGDTPELQRRLDDTVGRWFAECCELTGAQLDFIGECKVIPAEGGPAA